MNIQDKAKQSYKVLATGQDLALASGRMKSMEGSEKAIAQDIIAKLNLRRGDSFLDAGCGVGFVTKNLLEYIQREDVQATMIDIPEVLERLHQEFPDLMKGLQFLPGHFPEALGGKKLQFDKIVTYSVLHYVENPYQFVDDLVQCLAPGGSCLIGDIPNGSKKGRFLSTQYGRQFDADYKKIPLEENASYRDQYDFISRMPQLNLHLTDDFLLGISRKYRAQNYEVFILPQNSDLPFCKTREDLLIVRNFS